MQKKNVLCACVGTRERTSHENLASEPTTCPSSHALTPWMSEQVTPCTSSPCPAPSNLLELFRKLVSQLRKSHDNPPRPWDCKPGNRPTGVDRAFVPAVETKLSDPGTLLNTSHCQPPNLPQADSVRHRHCRAAAHGRTVCRRWRLRPWALEDAGGIREQETLVQR